MPIHLRVSSVRIEIGGLAKSIEFEVPQQHADEFTWASGQHLTLCFRLDDRVVRRSYTLSSSYDAGDPPRITVKRVRDGLVSNYINDQIEVGSEILVIPPSGKFTLIPELNAHRTHYFFGAGSGITPLYAMIRSVLYCEPFSDAHLIYGNHDHTLIIFLEEINQLQKDFSKRFTVSHILSKQSLLPSFTPWRTGIVGKEAIKAAVDHYPPYAQNTQYYICGPGSMNESVAAELRNIDVPSDRIHTESFGGHSTLSASIEGTASLCTVELGGETLEVMIDPNQTVLDAIRKSGHTPPFSCESGVCGSCKARLLSGSVHMNSCPSLNETEIEKSYILTCQSVPTAHHVHIRFDKLNTDRRDS